MSVLDLARKTLAKLKAQRNGHVARHVECVPTDETKPKDVVEHNHHNNETNREKKLTEVAEHDHVGKENTSEKSEITRKGRLRWPNTATGGKGIPARKARLARKAQPRQANTLAKSRNLKARKARKAR